MARISQNDISVGRTAARVKNMENIRNWDKTLNSLLLKCLAVNKNSSVGLEMLFLNFYSD